MARLTNCPNMRIARALLALCLSLAACLTAQTKAAPKGPSAAAPAGSRSQAHVSDSQLEAAIRAKFAKSKSSHGFNVRVQAGVAHIDGRTEVVQHKAAATRMAKNAGATAVDNRVQVSEAAKKKASENLEEGRRRAQVKRSDPRDARK
jgi:hypothetical protein